MSGRIVNLGIGAVWLAAIVTLWIALRRPETHPQELPPWFGDTSRPTSRLAGKVFGAKGPTTVHLLLDIPDPGSWKGPQLRTTATGEFDFGPMRAGPYQVFAEGDGELSRMAHIQTERQPGDRLELFIYDRDTIEHAIDVADGFFSPDWDLPREFVRTRAIRPWESIGDPLHGTVVRSDGSPAAGVGVQPVTCSDNDHSFPADEPTIATTDAAGTFTTFPAAEACGVRVWMGSRFHEAEIQSMGVAHTVHLPVPGSEQHQVFNRHRRDFADPAGAWIRGQIVRNGRGVPDADVSAVVLPVDNFEIWDLARTRADGSFEVFVSSHDLDESHDVLIEASHPLDRVRGRRVVRVLPGEHLDGVRIEVGPGLAVSGIVVDERGAPVPSVHVECTGWVGDTSPTRSDGAFRLTVTAQGRCRLHAVTGADEELVPSTGIAPKIDVTHPVGMVENVRFVVRRGVTRSIANTYAAGYVDLGLDARHELVRAVGDELGAAGLRVDDVIIEATHAGKKLADYALAFCGYTVWGGDIELTVKRGTELVQVRARAPTFESD